MIRIAGWLDIALVTLVGLWVLGQVVHGVIWLLDYFFPSDVPMTGE